MGIISRRDLHQMALLLAGRSRGVAATNGIEEILRTGVSKHKIPAAVAMVATAEKTTYSGAFGTRDAESGTPVTAASIFRIASMTKPITTTAALQLVERGKLALDEPVSKYLAELSNLFFWIDPRRGLCATLLMQFLPFVDAQAVSLLREFEQAVYRTA